VSRIIAGLSGFNKEDIPILEISLSLARDRLADLLAKHWTLREKIEKVLVPLP